MKNIFDLPLDLIGLGDLPGIPVVGAQILESKTLQKLIARTKKLQEVSQGYTEVYSIGDKMGTGHRFMFGTGVTTTDARIEAKENLQKLLENNPEAALNQLYRITFREKGNDNKNQDDDFMGSFLEKPEQFAISWLSDRNIRENGQKYLADWSATLTDADKADEWFWKSISEHSFAYNLLILQKITPDKLRDIQKKFRSVWKDEFTESAENGNLFFIDLEIFEEAKARTVKGFKRFTPATFTILQQDPETKNLKPVAIRVAGHDGDDEVFYSRENATNSAWLYALQAVKVSVTVYGIWFGHVYHWHIVSAAMHMSFYNNVDEKHPLYQLIDPQSDYLMEFDTVLMLIWDSIAPPTSFNTAYRFLRMSDKFAEGRNYFDDDPLMALAKNGITKEDFSKDEDWDKYKVVKNYIRIWESCEKYVQAFVKHYYPNDKAVEKDEQLQDWIDEAKDDTDGNIRGLAPIKTTEKLAKMLTSLVYRLTVHGASRLNSTGHPVLSFVGNFPPCLQKDDIPSPKTELTTQELLRYMPNTGSIGDMMEFLLIFTFSEPYESYIPKEGVDEKLFFGKDKTHPCNQALIELRTEIVSFMDDYNDIKQYQQWPLNIET